MGNVNAGMRVRTRPANPIFTRRGPGTTVPHMASEFDDTDFVDRDFVAAQKSGAGTGPGPGGRPPTREELESRLSENQIRLANLKRAQEELERERASVEEARRRRIELQTGRDEMLRNLTRGVGVLEQAEFAARRDSEQMTKTLADFRDALAKVQSIDEETWNRENWENELTRALTAIENARMEWNGARLKWPVLEGESPANHGGVLGRLVPGVGGSLSEGHSFRDLCRVGLALTWPLALVALGALVVFALALFRK